MVSLKIDVRKKDLTWLVPLVAVLVVGVVYALTPGVASNPGHVIDNVAPPAGCVNGQVLQFIDSVNGWGCVDASSGGDNLGNHIATQNLNLNNKKIINLASPVSNDDAATKGYVDAAVEEFGFLYFSDVNYCPNGWSIDQSLYGLRLASLYCDSECNPYYVNPSSNLWSDSMPRSERELIGDCSYDSDHLWYCGLANRDVSWEVKGVLCSKD